MSENFKVGDTVRMRSGGPRMTVTAVGGDNDVPKVTCVWFDGMKQMEATFPSAAVMDAPETKAAEPPRAMSMPRPG